MYFIMKKKLCLSLVVFILLFTFFVTSISAKPNSDKVIGYRLDSNRNEYVIRESDLPTLRDDIVSTSGYIPDGVGIDLSLSTSVNNLDSIIGTDDRVMLTDDQYSLFPYCTICKVSVSFNEGISRYGTGFLVGPRTILTAAHVVYDCETTHYGWADSVSISIGEHLNSNNVMVYTYSSIQNITGISCGVYNNTNDSNDDWAIIDLGIDAGYTCGYIGLTSVLYENSSVRCPGYSHDHPYNICYGDGTAYNISTYKFDHNCDILSGVSGGPLIVNSMFACGIQSTQNYFGNDPDYSGDYNTACKISSYIVGWINERLEDED